MIDIGHPDVSFAMNAVRQAAALAQQIQAEIVTPALTKDDKSPVTIADFSSQAVVAGLLSKYFSGDALIAEESSAVLLSPVQSDSLHQIVRYVNRVVEGVDADQVCRWIDRGTEGTKDRNWALDPIDGTKGFLRGDQYVVALALIEKGVVQLGVLGCPNLTDGQKADFAGPGSLVIAHRGRGTWVTTLHGEGKFIRLNVSTEAEYAQARILRSFEDSHTNAGQIDRIAHLLHTTTEPVRMDSQAKYAMLASGQGDLSLRMLSPDRSNYREKIWDQAAGSIIVEEAGGRITDLDGKSFDFSHGRTLACNRGVLASNGFLHEAALRAVKVAESYE